MEATIAGSMHPTLEDCVDRYCTKLGLRAEKTHKSYFMYFVFLDLEGATLDSDK